MSVYQGDFSEDSTINFTFTTSNGSGGAVAPSSAFEAADLKIYKNNSATEKATTNGVTMVSPFDTITGLHHVSIDTSNDTGDADFWQPGNDYIVVLSPDETVDSQTVVSVVAHFSIENRFQKDVQAVGGALNFEATTDNTGGAIKAVTFVGTQTGTYTNTEANDGAYHQITHATNAIDIVYEFSVGGGRTATQVDWSGYLDSANDEITVQAYDFIGADWETRAVITGQNNAANTSRSIPLLSKHTGTGSDIGKVLIRFVCSAQTSPILYTDLLLVEAVNLGQSVGYENGAVWLDTSLSNTNTEDFVDGVADNPVSTIGAANTLLTSTGLRKLEVASGSSFTLAATINNILFIGHGYDVALGGQDIDDCHFFDAYISGTATAANEMEFHNCEMGTVSLQNAHLYHCGLEATTTLTLAGDYNFIDCYSSISGGGTPVLTKTLAQAVNVNFRRYSGGIEIQNLEAGDKVSIEGHGQVIINANCTGGEVKVRGIFKVTDNASGAVDLEQVNPVATQVSRGKAQSATANTITLEAGESTVDGQYDPGQILIVSGTGAGQSRNIIDYNGTTKVAIVDKDWRVNPDSTSSYLITVTSPQLHVNEGQAQAGAASTITLNTAASSTDDIYIGQSVFLVGGTGQDQSRIVTDYDGTTKVATVHKAWDIVPDSTTSYVMVPLPTIGDYIVNATPALISDAVWDEVFSEHTISGSFGRLVKNLGEGVVSIDGSVNDVGATATTFITTLTETTTSHYRAKTIVFTTGALTGQCRPIDVYDGTTKSITVTSAFTEAPADGDDFLILALYIDPISDIATATRTEIDSNSTQLAAILEDTGTTLNTHLTDIKGGAFDGATDSLEAIRDRGDAAWVTGGAGSLTAADIRTEIDANSTQLAAIVADTNEMQNDLANGGRIDVLIDGIKAVTDLLPDAGALTSIAQASDLATVDTVADAIKVVVDAVKAVTDALPDAGALTSIAQASDLATVDSNVDAILIDTSTTIPNQIDALDPATVNGVLNTQLSETYAAAGQAPTLAQALLMIQQRLGDFSISDTTLTVKRLNSSNTAATYTLDDPDEPSSITRTS